MRFPQSVQCLQILPECSVQVLGVLRSQSSPSSCSQVQGISSTSPVLAPCSVRAPCPCAGPKNEEVRLKSWEITSLHCCNAVFCSHLLCILTEFGPEEYQAFFLPSFLEELFFLRSQTLG